MKKLLLLMAVICAGIVVMHKVDPVHQEVLGATLLGAKEDADDAYDEAQTAYSAMAQAFSNANSKYAEAISEKNAALGRGATQAQIDSIMNTHMADGDDDWTRAEVHEEDGDQFDADGWDEYNVLNYAIAEGKWKTYIWPSGNAKFEYQEADKDYDAAYADYDDAVQDFQALP